MSRRPPTSQPRLCSGSGSAGLQPRQSASFGQGLLAGVRGPPLGRNSSARPTLMHIAGKPPQLGRFEYRPLSGAQPPLLEPRRPEERAGQGARSGSRAANAHRRGAGLDDVRTSCARSHRPGRGGSWHVATMHPGGAMLIELRPARCERSTIKRVPREEGARSPRARCDGSLPSGASDSRPHAGTRQRPGGPPPATDEGVHPWTTLLIDPLCGRVRHPLSTAVERSLLCVCTRGGRLWSATCRIHGVAF